MAAKERTVDIAIATKLFGRALQHDWRDAMPCEPNDCSWYCHNCHLGLWHNNVPSKDKTPCLAGVPDYLNDANADQAVLDHINQRWDDDLKGQYAANYFAALHDRAGCDGPRMLLAHRTGDYTRAAIRTLDQAHT